MSTILRVITFAFLMIAVYGVVEHETLLAVCGLVVAVALLWPLVRAGRSDIDRSSVDEPSNGWIPMEQRGRHERSR